MNLLYSVQIYYYYYYHLPSCFVYHCLLTDSLLPATCYMLAFLPISFPTSCIFPAEWMSVCIPTSA